MDDLTLPSAEQVRAALAPFNLKQLEALAEVSGIPFTTLYKIAKGKTDNPGIETLRKFVPYIGQVLAGDAAKVVG